ncbi:MAG: membrane protein FxsA [Candidatus Dadabacteria bacterium]|nr:membrane protein FxsA [Candidatus Dadabacteria bacterium]
MFSKLVLLFVGVPLLELFILVKLGGAIGIWPTIGIVLVTGVLGASVARYEGLRVLNRINDELRYGRMPAEELFDGLLILIGGIVLLTPGLLTDLFGFSLLVPVTRRMYKEWLRRRFDNMIRSGETRFTYIIR